MRVVFVCTANMCRSPLAERLARKDYPEHCWESAGAMPFGPLHPFSAQVICERGGDPNDFAGRSLHALDLSVFDHVVLIGRVAARLSQLPPETCVVHKWDVADPYEVVGPKDLRVAAFRSCADELERRIASLTSSFGGKQ